MNARSWPDEDAQRDRDELIRRAHRVGVSPGHGMTGYGLRGTREYCLVMGRHSCMDRLRRNIRELRSNYGAVGRVWAAERAKANRDAKRRHEAECRRRFAR